MADGTKIEWTDATWNRVRGCSRVSEGCRNCYAEVMAAFVAGRGEAVIVTTGRACGWGRECADLIVNGESAVETGLAAGWLRPWPSCEAGRCRGAARPKWCEGETR